MEFYYYLSFCVICFCLGAYLIYLIVGRNNGSNSSSNSGVKSGYYLKNFMTQNESKFYNILVDLEKSGKYVVHPQVNLASVLDKTGNRRYYNELFRNIDFAIFNKDYSKLLLLIELNDASHNQSKRKKRDLKVKEICNSAGIKLMTFYTKYPNEKAYVINRILNEIKDLDN